MLRADRLRTEGARAHDLRPLRPLRALGDGVWFAALVVLVVNDHYLKHAGLVPGWLTGKLSDFAGLVVAPPLVALLLRARDERRLLAGWLLTALGFTAIKTIPAASAIYDALLGFGGHNVVDPSDLMALAVLPPAYLRARRTMRRGVDGRHHPVLAMAGAVACIATPARMTIVTCPPDRVLNAASTCEEAFAARAFVGNMGKTTATVSVRTPRPDADIDCGGLLRLSAHELACALPEDRFGAPTQITLPRNENAAIVGAERQGCAIALVSIDDWHTSALMVQRLDAAPLSSTETSDEGAAPTTQFVPYNGIVALPGGVYVDCDQATLSAADVIVPERLWRGPYGGQPRPGNAPRNLVVPHHCEHAP